MAGSGDDVAIDFSVEELVALALLLGQPLLPGLGEDPLAALDAGQRDAVLDSARRSLVARRVVVGEETSDHKITLEVLGAVASLLAAASSPGILSRVEHEIDGRVETGFFMSVPEVSVEHSALVGGVHQLTPFATEDLLARVLDVCGLEERPAIDAKPFATTLGALRQCGACVEQGDLDAARDALGDNDAVSAFVRAVSTRTASSRVTILHRPDDTHVEGGELTWLDGGEHGLWITPTPDTGFGSDPDFDESLTLPVAIKPARATEIAEELFSYLPRGSD